MDPELTAEEERFMRWLEEDDVTGHHAGESPGVPGDWHVLRRDVDQLRDLLRSNIPVTKEPPASDTFNEEVRRKLG